MPYTRAFGAYELSTEKVRLDVDAIHAALSASYWAAGRPRHVVEASIEGALCFGVYHGGVQVGFARAITDGATFAYLADVYVAPDHQGRGVGNWLVASVLDHPRLQGLRRWLLATRDALRPPRFCPAPGARALHGDLPAPPACAARLNAFARGAYNRRILEGR